MGNIVLYVDNTYGTIAAGITAAATSITLTTGHGARFPVVATGQVLYATMVSSANVVEEIHITAHTAASDTLTVTRGANGTTAKAWAAGDRIECRLTSEHMDGLAARGGIISITDYAAGDGSDEHAAIQRFFDAAAGGKLAIVPAPSASYGLGSTKITLIAGQYNVQGRGSSSLFTFAGSGLAIDGTTNSGINGTIQGIAVTCTHVDASGVSFGNATQGIRFIYNYLTGPNSASASGEGLLLDANATAETFSGMAEISMNTIQRFKYGIRATGAGGERTWTSIGGHGNYLIGRSAGVVAGSRGIYFDTNTNGVGTIFTGGTIEAFERPIECVNPCVGLTWLGDIEGNTSNIPILGTSWNGEIQNAQDYLYAAGSNGAVNRWWREQKLSGVWTSESYYSRIHNIYDGSGTQRWGLTRGQSTIDGGLPQDKFIVSCDAQGGTNPKSNFMRLLNHKIAWSENSVAPTAGSWNRGDVIWNPAVAAAGSPGWMCVTTGTFSAATDNTGDTDGSTAVITGMTDTSDFAVGNFVNASAGFAVLTGLEILAITATTITVDRNSNAVASNITIDTSDPVFKAMANVAA